MVWGRSQTLLFSYRNLLGALLVKNDDFSPLKCHSIGENSIDHKHMGLFLDTEFYSIDLYVYPYTMPASLCLDFGSSIPSFEIEKC